MNAPQTHAAAGKVQAADSGTGFRIEANLLTNPASMHRTSRTA